MCAPLNERARKFKAVEKLVLVQTAATIQWLCSHFAIIKRTRPTKAVDKAAENG